MLRVADLHAYYGRAHILHGVAFAVARRRGAGAARPQRRGQEHDDEVAHRPACAPRAGASCSPATDIAGWEPHRIARLGLGYVPEDRRIFSDLTVLENLEVGRQPARDGRPPWTPERLFALFPNLARTAPPRRRRG